MLAWQNKIKALIEAKADAALGASEDSIMKRPAGAGIGDAGADDDTDSDTIPYDDTDQVDDTAQVADSSTNKKKENRKGKKGGATRDTAKIKRLDAEGTPAAKAEAERLRRRRCGGGAKMRQRREEQHEIEQFITTCVDIAKDPDQYMKIAERKAEAASSSQQ